MSHLLGKLGGKNLSTQRNVQSVCFNGFILHPGQELVKLPSHALARPSILCLSRELC